MADYYLVLDGAFFEEQARPTLALAWQERGFEPCRGLCLTLEPAARSYAERYHTGEQEPLLFHVIRGLAFDRMRWRTLVGEILLFAALEIPEFQSNADTLCCLLAPEQYRAGETAPKKRAPIQQALFGSRDLTFGTAVYRPDRAGYNGRDDVVRLAAYLADIRPERWTVADLAAWREGGEEERGEELEFVREWLPVLVDLYRRGAAEGRVLVHESIP
jgi:hypothetical protein